MPGGGGGAPYGGIGGIGGIPPGANPPGAAIPPGGGGGCSFGCAGWPSAPMPDISDMNLAYSSSSAGGGGAAGGGGGGGGGSRWLRGTPTTSFQQIASTASSSASSLPNPSWSPRVMTSTPTSASSAATSCRTFGSVEPCFSQPKALLISARTGMSLALAACAITTASARPSTSVPRAASVSRTPPLAGRSSALSTLASSVAGAARSYRRTHSSRVMCRPDCES
mmetsp:Transcript_16262/g.51419  ORF Transcript_16262/g.51419 Transcript_16262/m.51419 type:complete len:224 (+) Transcript_16262:493-1164(+)